MPTPPLTGAQRASCFEIAEAIYATQAQAHDGFRIQFYWLQAMNLDTVVNALNGYLDNNINTDVSKYDKVVALIEQWDGISGDEYEISGNIGSITGFNYSPKKERARIQQQMLIYIPLFTLANAHIHRAAAEDGNEGKGAMAEFNF